MKKTIFVARSAVIATLYAAITIATSGISYANVQVRVAEALTILPLFYLEAIPGLTIGCLIANVFSSPIDMFIGTLATLISAILTRAVKKWYFAIVPPIIINALMVPLVWLAVPEMPAYYVNVIFVLVGQMISVCAFGIPLYFGLSKKLKK